MQFFRILLIFTLLATNLYSQCGCLGGAAIGGIIPTGGSANSGSINEGKIRASLFYRYGFGNEYYSKDSKIGKNVGTIRENRFHYLGLNLGYGITENLTAELEIGYFLQKLQDFYDYTLKTSGLSHITPTIKYNLYNSLIDQIEYTAGISLRIPSKRATDTLPQHLLPSTGALGFAFISFLHKGFKKEQLHLFLINKYEINTVNNIDYLYGNSFLTSFIISKTFGNYLTGAVEIRNEYRAKDKYKGEKLEDSGNFELIIAPQLGLGIDNFYCSLNFDYPFYKYFNGKQLTNSYYLGINIIFQTK